MLLTRVRSQTKVLNVRYSKIQVIRTALTKLKYLVCLIDISSCVDQQLYKFNITL